MLPQSYPLHHPKLNPMAYKLFPGPHTIGIGAGNRYRGALVAQPACNFKTDTSSAAGYDSCAPCERLSGFMQTPKNALRAEEVRAYL